MAFFALRILFQTIADSTIEKSRIVAAIYNGTTVTTEVTKKEQKSASVEKIIAMYGRPIFCNRAGFLIVTFFTKYKKATTEQEKHTKYPPTKYTIACFEISKIESISDLLMNYYVNVKEVGSKCFV